MTVDQVKIGVSTLHSACLRYSNGGEYTPKFVVKGIVDSMDSIDPRVRELYKENVFDGDRFISSLMQVMDKVIRAYFA